MWTKLIEYSFKHLLMPLITKGLEWVWKYFNEKQEDSTRNNKIDEATNKIKEAKTDEERKKALDEFVRGIGSLRV